MNATERARRSDALYRDDAKMHRRDLCDMVAQREAEIAELRELLQDTLMSPQDYCEKYGIDYEGWNSANNHIDARMRKLGIEVDE